MRWEELKDITFGENAVDSETMTVVTTHSKKQFRRRGNITDFSEEIG